MQINFYNTQIQDLKQINPTYNFSDKNYREAKNLERTLAKNYIPREILSLFEFFNLDIHSFYDFSYFNFFGNKVGDRIDYVLYYNFIGTISDNLFLELKNIFPYPMSQNSKIDKYFGLNIVKSEKNITLELYFKSEYLILS